MSFSRRDYIKRMIEQLAEAVAALLGVARAGNTTAALETLERTRTDLFGALRRSLDILDPASVMALLGDLDKVRAYAHLYLAEAEVRELRGEMKLAIAARRRALETWLEIAVRHPEAIDENDRRAVEALAARVDASRFADRHREALIALIAA